jgi:hypothetical protein
MYHNVSVGMMTLLVSLDAYSPFNLDTGDVLG